MYINYITYFTLTKKSILQVCCFCKKVPGIYFNRGKDCLSQCSNILKKFFSEFWSKRVRNSNTFTFYLYSVVCSTNLTHEKHVKERYQQLVCCNTSSIVSHLDSSKIDATFFVLLDSMSRLWLIY